MKTYLALTIGPIYTSIQNAKKVRELFGASYFFSWFMRQVIRNLTEHDNIKIVVPYTNEDLLVNPRSIGFFHDRFIATTTLSPADAKQRLEEAIASAIRLSAGIIGVPAKALENYLTLHSLALSSEDLQKIDFNPILALNRLLDAKELHYPFVAETQPTFTYECTEAEKKIFEQERFDNLSAVNLFGYRLPHLKKALDIEFNRFKSTADLAGESDYFVVVTADGDRMGKKITGLMQKGEQDLEKINELSQSLYRFFFGDDKKGHATDIRTLTNNAYGGELIFAGGDDILALLPVRHGDKTFLDYLDELSKRFKAIVGDDVSLSFGVNIVYYKYPMKNAISEAFDLLHEAKKWEKSPNVAKIQLVKHSGQKYDTLHALSEPAFATLDILIKGTLAHKERTGQKKPCDHTDTSPCFALPHAVHHTLDLYRGAIVKTLEEDRNLKPIFDKIFDDARSDAQKTGLTYLRKHIEALRPTTKEGFNRLFGDLNIVKFLRGDRDDLPA